MTGISAIGRALGHEVGEEMQAVPGDADDGHAEEHEQRHRRGDDDVAGDGEGYGTRPNRLANRMNMNSENTNGKYWRPRCRRCLFSRPETKVVHPLAQRLPAAGHDRLLAGAEQHEDGDRGDRDNHPQRRIGEGSVEAADMDRGDWFDCELRERRMSFSHDLPRPIPDL
jgi:hypothetical protein